LSEERDAGSNNNNSNFGFSGTTSNKGYMSYYGPGGRMLLVESALEAVGRGSTTIGIKTPAFALTSSYIKPTRPLMEPSEKIFAIDDHVGATGSGYIGDILQSIDELRIEAQKHRLTIESPIDVASLVKHLSSYLHTYTIYAVRPQAASIIIAGMDQMGTQLYQVDPGGTYFRGSAFTIGQFSDSALSLIQQEYSADMSAEQAIQLSKRAIERAVGEDKPLVGIGIVYAEEGKFKKL
jgi:proteasome alpha subunit